MPTPLLVNGTTDELYSAIRRMLDTSFTARNTPFLANGHTPRSDDSPLPESLDALPVHALVPVGPAEEEAARRLIHSDFYDHLPPDTALLMRTSGSSSGVGKTVMISRTALMASAAATHAVLGGPGNWVCALPTHHIAGFQTVFRAALAGTRAIHAGRGTPEELASAAEELAGEPTYLSLVPTQLRRLLDSPQLHQARSFSAILLGGAAAAPELLHRAYDAGLTIVTTYGMTETCGGCVYNGVPIGNTRLTLGTGGQITISGDVVATGYLAPSPSTPSTAPGGSISSNEASSQVSSHQQVASHPRPALKPFGGSFTTQDSGRWSNGKLQILGRLDSAITTGGLTVIPGIIERELENMGAGECVVVGIPDDQWGEIVVALTTHPLNNPAAQLRERFEAGYVPKLVVSAQDLGLASLPYLESGKVDRVTAARLIREKL